MSVSQMKKQFEEMAAYLGRDVAGLEKLRKLKEGFHELRNQLASAAQAKELAESRTESIFNEATQAKSELMSVRNENHRLNQLVENLKRDLAEATKAEPDAEAELDVRDLTKDRRQYHATLKELRRHVQHCPRFVKAEKIHRTISTIYFYKREELAQGWTYRAMWQLGASVAVLAAFGHEVGIVTDDRIKELEPYEDDSIRQVHQTLEWLRKNINFDDGDPIGDVCHYQRVMEKRNAIQSRARE